MLVHDHEDMYVYGKERKCDALREAQGECCLRRRRSAATLGVIRVEVLVVLVVTVVLASVLLRLLKASGCLDASVSETQWQHYRW